MKLDKTKILKVGGAVAGLALLIGGSTGCAKWKNEIAAKGGIFGSYAGDYIVVSQSGGKVMDVYKLRDTIVQSEENSDGWLFKDQNGNPVNLGGDVKVIRLNEKTEELWDKYFEYHMEFETQTYREKFKDKLNNP